MRDIRNDLKQRARLIEDEISAAYAEYEKMVERLQIERDGRLSTLQTELAALGKVIESENRRVTTEPPMAEPPRIAEPQRMAEPPRRMQNDMSLALPQPPQAQLSLGDFILHKLNELGPLSKDDLINLTLQEGIYADPDAADHGVHAGLVGVIHAEQVRQLHDGTFVPNTLPPALRVRRAG